MPMERMTAKKVRIKDILQGEWIKREGFEPSFVATAYGDKLSRVRVLGTVVGKFVAEDSGFASITLDDFTGTIRAKTFKSLFPLENVNAGDIVDVTGKLREYNGEIYIMPETAAIIRDPNFEILRRLEIAKYLRAFGSVPQDVEKPDGDVMKSSADRGELKREILKIIESNPDGVEFSAIMNSISADENSIDAAVTELLEEGICYEPVPGKIKKI